MSCMGDRFPENDGFFLSPVFPWKHSIGFHVFRYQCEPPMKELAFSLQVT